MVTGDPAHQVFWFASRALGIVAIALLGLTVSLGLLMAGRLGQRPGLQARLKHFHEASALVTLALIAGHGGVLLLDGYLRPGVAGVALPFALSYRPLFTGIGIIAGWLALILGLSYYARRWIGAKTWRQLHRLMIVVYLLALGHVLGAGTDAASVWMLALLTLLTAPVVFGFTYRALPGRPRTRPVASPRVGPRASRVLAWRSGSLDRNTHRRSAHCLAIRRSTVPVGGRPRMPHVGSASTLGR